MTLIYFLFVFAFFCAKNIGAIDVTIEQVPVAEDIDYGEPLFESALSGGVSNVEGVFRWNKGEQLLEVGEHDVEVVFEPNDKLYSSVNFFVKVNVNKRRVYLKFESDIYKQYDDTRDIKLPNYIVGGIRKGDGVYISGELKGTLESGLVSTSTKVILSGIELIGNKKENYYLDLEGFSAKVYPKYIEKFIGDKNRIQLDKNAYVPINTAIYVEEIEEESLTKEGYTILNSYDVYIASDNDRIDMNKPVKVKIKIDENNFNYERLHVYNYYNNSYEEIVDYKYEDGYFVYSASSLGQVVFAQKELNFWWAYLLGSLFTVSALLFVILALLKNRKKINKYKSLKRRKDYGDCY